VDYDAPPANGIRRIPANGVPDLSLISGDEYSHFTPRRQDLNFVLRTPRPTRKGKLSRTCRNIGVPMLTLRARKHQVLCSWRAGQWAALKIRQGDLGPDIF